MSIQFDYTYDTSGFFDAPERRAALERAGAELTAGMRDDLAAIVPSGGNTWVAYTTRPDTGISLDLPNLTLARGVVLVFAGARPIPGLTVGQASLITPSSTASGTAEWQELVQSRGQAGVLDGTPTDTALWGGSVVFDAEEEWDFGTDPAGGADGRTDFQATALHELAHLFGFTDSNLAFRRHVSGYTFTGPASVAEYGGPVPTEEAFLVNSAEEFIRTAPSHWSQAVLSRGRPPRMTPALVDGAQSSLTPLDLAALRDIGWDIDSPPRVSDVTDRTVAVGVSTGAVAFTVADDETSAELLTVTAASSDAALVPAGAVAVTGSGANRVVTVTPAPGQFGTATITLTVRDAGGLTASDTFVLTVLPLPPPPAGGVSLAVSGSPTGTAAVFRPDASGQFAAAASTAGVFGGFAGDVRAAAGDFDKDGVEDTVLVTGPGTKTMMAVVSGKDGAVLLPATDPFGDANFTFGGFVTAGDIDGDGRAEWVVTPELRGGPRVVIFQLDLSLPTGYLVVANFFGIGDPSFRDGDRAALGDVNGDGVLDVFSIAAFNGGPRTALYDGRDMLVAGSQGRDPVKLVGDFFATVTGTGDGRGGRSIAAGDVSGDGKADLIVTGDNLLLTGNQVTVFSGADLVAGRVPGFGATPLADFTASELSPTALVSVAAVDGDGDTRADLAVGSGAGQPSRVKVYLGKDLSGPPAEPVGTAFDPFGTVTLNGVFVG